MGHKETMPFLSSLRLHRESRLISSRIIKLGRFTASVPINLDNRTVIDGQRTAHQSQPASQPASLTNPAKSDESELEDLREGFVIINSRVSLLLLRATIRNNNMCPRYYNNKRAAGRSPPSLLHLLQATVVGLVNRV